MPSKDSQFTNEELALAYELRQEGCCWKRIALGLGCDWVQLNNRVRNAKLGGLIDPRIRLPQEALLGAHIMRTKSRLSWAAIGRYYGTSASCMRAAYHRRYKKNKEKDHLSVSETWKSD